MGKGDKKTKKGKIWMGSFGNTRPRPNASSDNSIAKDAKPKAEKKEAPAKKASTATKAATAKKTTAKKKTEKADK
ncbi:RPS31 30S ribosomal protein S31 [Marivirga sericea]|uniref:RPS31 30S ribosomal protein S31 n=1 Tax=Marivirga sericea TaxID=1028 RepID=A0A1X7L3R4_9BACT|nr:30S ribosomal protein THX [Marivirga sericea]SMG48380.1 RPS31 30S ribosomal protein S31 [Marivirga sericea]